MTRATELEEAALRALNEHIGQNRGRAPRLLEMALEDWKIVEAHLTAVRKEAGFRC